MEKAMAYDTDFYRLYADYLKETNVREAHDRVFQMVGAGKAFRNVIDLGCGLSEFYQYTSPRKYVGIDLNAPVADSKEFRLVPGNYRDVDLVRTEARKRRSTSFISIFSAEITDDVDANRSFYEALFHAVPTFKTGLVSGFYYERRKHINPVVETGNIVSWQTLGTMERYASPVFEQVWISLPVPSTMFGDDVVEVWRLLKRKTA